MFFATYLRRELGRRMGQALVIALGLALGVGLVTVAAASAGYNRAESQVLSGLYGVATDVTVAGARVKPELTGPPTGKIPAASRYSSKGRRAGRTAPARGARTWTGRRRTT
jgi:hypothetical protein